MLVIPSQVQWKRIDSRAKVPTKGTPASAGWDLYALEDCSIEPTVKGPLVPVRTGIAVQPPLGHYMRIAGRSGLCFKHGLVVTAGVVDADFVDEVKVLFVNPTAVPVHFKAGDRIAQALFEPIYTGDAIVVSEFSHMHEVQHRGFGSTGN